MIQRIATAAILVPFILYIVLWAPGWAFLAVLGAVGALCLYEFADLAAGHGAAFPRWLALAGGLALMAAPGFEAGAVVVAMVLLGAVTLRSTDLTKVLPAAGAGVLGVVYVFGAWRCAAALRGIDPQWLMFALGLNWIGDTGALAAGRLLGRNRLAPQVSPAKTWEGAAGSLATALLFAWVWSRFLPHTPLFKVLAICAAANIAGQIGDLCESALKRGAHVKDSSRLLPGHGGWLDRVDSSLFAVPVVYFLVRWWR